jgi:hypothetical protein
VVSAWREINLSAFGFRKHDVVRLLWEMMKEGAEGGGGGGSGGRYVVDDVDGDDEDDSCMVMRMVERMMTTAAMVMGGRVRSSVGIDDKVLLSDAASAGLSMRRCRDDTTGIGDISHLGCIARKRGNNNCGSLWRSRSSYFSRI